MIGIVMVDRNWSLDSSGKQPIHLQKDLARFEEITIGNIVIMGRKTLEQLPGGRPLKNRLNIVLSSSRIDTSKYDNLVHRCDERGLYSYLMNQLSGCMCNPFGRSYVIGGAQTLNHFMELGWLEYIYITQVDIEFPNPTTRLKIPSAELSPTRLFKRVPYIQQIKDYDKKTGDSFNTEFEIYVKKGPIDVTAVPG